MVQLFNDAVKSEEKKFQQEFNRLNLSKDFYFSYSYHLGRTVQVNMADAARARASGARYARHPLYVESDANKHHRFVWNHHHMEPFLRKESWQRWCLPIIHGFFHYAKCVFGWSFEVVLIARRSRFYAGTRYRTCAPTTRALVLAQTHTHVFSGVIRSFRSSSLRCVWRPRAAHE